MDISKLINSSFNSKNETNKSVIPKKKAASTILIYKNESTMESIFSLLRSEGIELPHFLKLVGGDSNSLSIPEGTSKVFIEVEEGDDINSLTQPIKDKTNISTSITVISKIDKVSFNIKVEEMGMHYVLYPGDNSKLIDSFKGTSTERRITRKSKNITVYGIKGGVGCSFVATKLALSLSKHRKKDTVLVGYGNGSGCYDIFYGDKNIEPNLLVNEARNKDVDYSFYESLSYKINDNLKILNFLIEENDGREVLKINDGVVSSASEHCNFIVRDFSSARFIVSPDLLAKDTDVLILVADTSFLSQRELAKTLVEFQNKEINVRIITVVVQKSKSNITYQKSEIEKLINSKVDVMVPYDKNVDDNLVDKLDIFYGNNKVGQAITNISNIVFGEEVGTKKSIISLITDRLT
ncbi:AAA family ATPase [Vibrio caribbeanicus]|uniref:AAA family ATPase n=1 Tax=Vibrio caribbeanicus TaxID=701175 RepID=UPI002283ADE8|nr:hypothetical protein [Vibrio caribbeanicus]MCY9845597.1 hypothetical protein [Vibrio caribbeanicus]